MATANNCNVPEDLFYWVREHVWVRPEADGTITIGMTDAAQHLAKTIVTATPKGAGKTVKKGKSSGTVESGKWVGPIKSPVSGEIVAVNEAIVKNPRLLNEDLWGWLVIRSA
jgi:glycine cleavage system H protein